MNLNRIVNALGTVDSVPFAPRCKLVTADPTVSDTTTPAPKKKSVGSAIGSALLTGLGNVASNLLGGIFQSNSNKENIAMQRETNALNYKMFKEQQAFNVDMWNKQNEYNTPQAQVDRLLAAGINPQAFFGAGQANTAGQINSPTAPTMQAARVNPYSPDLKVGDAVNAYYQSQLMNAQKKNINADTQHTEMVTLYEQKSMADRLKYLQKQAQREDWLGQLAKTQLKYEETSLNNRLLQLQNDVFMQNQQMDLNAENIIQARLQNDLYRLQVVYQPKMNDALLKQYYATTQKAFAEAKLALSNATLSEKEAELVAKKIVGQVIDNGLKSYDYNLKEQTIDTIVQSAYEDYIHKYNENRFTDIGPVRFERRSPFTNSQDWKGMRESW